MSRFIFILFLLTLPVGYSFAQVLPEDINISLYPAEPKPGQIVTATAESFGMDLTGTKVSWYYNDKIISSGIGKTKIQFTAPGIGQVANLSVIASSPLGDAQANTIIRPASVDVVWEAVDAYTPPFYKGKALAPIGGRIRATAIPSANSPKTLAYSWKYNDSAVPGQSGINRNSVNIKTDVLSNNESFSVQAIGGTFEGSGETFVTPRNPSIVAYLKSEGFVDFSKGFLKDIVFAKSGPTLFFSPFNFSVPSSIKKDLEFVVTTGSEDLTDSEHPNQTRVAPPEDGALGEISVTAQSIKNRFQQAVTKFNISIY